MKAVDLFCGCGGMSLGFENAGVDILCAYDNWDVAIAIYNQNFDHKAIKEDLYSADAVSTIRAYKPDMIFGGPPCQDFSIAGKRNIGKRGNLTIRFAEIVADIKPTWFVMENVYNIERMPVLPKTIEILRNAGYGITTQVLDASYCGVPQARHRFFMIGKLGEKDRFLTEKLISGLSEKPLTVRQYLGDKLGTDFYYMHPRSYNRRAVFSVDEPSATIRGINRPIPQGYKKHPADKADVADGKVRELTTKERSLLQTFPESFVFSGSKTDMEQAIGNAVPVKLAEYVAKAIMSYEHA